MPRLRGWHLSLCAGVALLATSSPISSPAAPDKSAWFETLRDDDHGLELVLNAPDVATQAPGDLVALGCVLPIAVPAPNGARVVVVHQETDAVEKATIDQMSKSGPISNSVAELLDGGQVRGLDVMDLVFRPLHRDADGRVAYTRRITLRIEFTARPARRDIANQRAPEPHALQRALLNAATAARWRAPQAERAPSWAPIASRRSAASALPAERIRVRIAERGIYQLRYQDLQGLLSASRLADIDPHTFKVVFDDWKHAPLDPTLPGSWEPDYQMHEAAIWVEGEEDDSFDSGDRIVFYALGPNGYEDAVDPNADFLAHYIHPYDKVRYAWLVWDDAPGLRVPAQVASAPEPLADPLVTRVQHRVHFETDRTFAPVDDLWYWEQVRDSRPARVDLDVDLGGETSAPAEMYLSVGAQTGFTLHAVDVRFDRLQGSVPIGTLVWWQRGVDPAPKQPFQFPVQLLATNPLDAARNRDLHFDPADPRPDSLRTSLQANGETLLLEVDLVWQRPLRVTNPTVALAWYRTPAVDVEVFELTGFGAAPLVWDVTDPQLPVRLTNPTAAGLGTWRVRHGRGAGLRSQYMAVVMPRVPAPTDIALRTVRPLRTRVTAPDMLIVTPASLRAEADRLAAHRRTHFAGAATADVEVIDVQEIYDEFSGGRMDPLAIRNYTKYLYERDAVPRLQHVLLFGDATHDPRQLTSGSTATLVPAVQLRSADHRILRPFAQHAVEDWFAEMDRPGSAANPVGIHPRPDVGVGRLAVRSRLDAGLVVAKLIAYEASTDYGAWRTRIILSADDECKPGGGCFESVHINNTEALVRLTPPEWDIDKVYLTEYPSTLGQKPRGRQDFVRRWTEGAAMVTYQGHGAPRQLADEVLFLGTDVPALRNAGRLPVFTAFSCTVSEFDDPQRQSLSEDLIASPEGGAIATMGATGPTFAGPNSDTNNEVWRVLFETGGTAKVPLGVALQLAKQRILGFSSPTNNEKYVLLGDPATTLLTPEYVVEFTSGHVRLDAGKTAMVAGIVRAPGTSVALESFSGDADIEVFGSADESGYTSATSGLRIPYDLLGPPLYRGRVQVEHGRFSFQFFVPLGAEPGSKARISAYAFAGAEDAKGAVNTVAVGVAAQPDTSAAKPRITLSFPNRLTKVKPGTLLVADVEDDNGVNIQGTSLRSSILLDFDESNQPLDVTALFRYEDGSATRGSLNIALPEDLEPGAHTATLVASDNLLNTSTATVAFEVVDAVVSQLSNVIAFPNPLHDRTHFFFEITDPSQVSVRVFTSSGREVWSEEREFSAATQGSIVWDGRDRTLDEVANGTYLYQLEARPNRAGAPTLRHTGKIVVMRD